MSRRRPGGVAYREGVCPEFGRIRPVHLHELSSVETRLELTNGRTVSSTRLGWCGSLSVPKQGEYLSLHRRRGKALVLVNRVGRSCVCCYTAMVFVHVSEVEGVLRQDRTCKCAAERAWQDSAAWNEEPGYGLCKRVGANSLSKISEAIKRKKNG